MKRYSVLVRRVKVFQPLLFVVVILVLLAFTRGVEARDSNADSHGFAYTVLPGDTLSSIARRYNTTVQAIVIHNEIVNPNLIYAGSIFWIPTTGVPTQPIAPPPPDQGCRYHHVVSWGDTMLKLGRQYGVSPWQIGQVNDIYNLNLIYRGQTLCIP